MELVWGSKDFVIAGQPYQGFPILLWDSMESCTQANLFFRRCLLRGEIGSKQSWPNTGRALYDFFSFLQAHDLDWRDVDRGEAKSLVAAYRDYCLVTCGLARNTTRQRLTYICKFYEFALEKGWVRRLPFGHEERIVPRETGFLEHVDASGGKALVNNVMPRSDKPLPKYLNMSQTKSLLSMAGNPHHRIMIQLALRTGLRRNELATFPMAYVVDPDKTGGTERNQVEHTHHMQRIVAAQFDSPLRHSFGREGQPMSKPTIEAPRRVQAAMKVNHILAAGAFVKVINILSDHSELGHMPGELGDSEVRSIRLRLRNLLPTPLVPPPTQCWIGSECFAGGELSKIEALP